MLTRILILLMFSTLGVVDAQLSIDAELGNVDQESAEARLAKVESELLEWGEDVVPERELFLRMESAFALMELERHGEARTFFRRALSLSRQLKEPGMILTNLSGLFEISFIAGHFRRASKYADDALVLAESMGRKDLVLRLVTNRAASEIRLQEYDTAIASFTAALELVDEEQDSLGYATLLSNLSVAYIETDDFGKAELLLDQALPIMRGMGTPLQVAAVLSNQSYLCLLREDFEQCGKLLEEALALRTEWGGEGDASSSYRSLGQLAWARGQFDEALEYLGKAQEIQVRLQLTGQLITTLTVLEDLYTDLDHYSEGQSIDLEGLMLADAMRLRDRHVLTLDNLASLYLERKLVRKALEYDNQARRLREQAYTVDLARTMAESHWQQEEQRGKHELDLLRKDNDIKDQQRGFLLLAGGTSLGIAVLGWTFFLRNKRVLKRLDHAHGELGRANEESVARSQLLEGAMVEINQLQEERIRADRLESMGFLAAGIAHDFNNVLAVVLTNVSMAKESDQGEEERMRMLNDAEAAVAQGQRLSSQLLVFSKGGEPQLELRNMAKLLRNAAELVSSGSNARLIFDLADDLWPARVDLGQISQLVGNLILNSIQAMPKGGSISIAARNMPSLATLDGEGPVLRIRISDEGPGFPQGFRQKVFEPYFTTKPEGSGLGLTTAHAIVDRHGGRMHIVDSESGASVEFELPAEPGEIKERPMVTSGIQRGEGKILVLDDDPMIRRLYQRALSQIGYQPSLTADGDAAIGEYTRARQSGHPFDMVILDLTLPGGRSGTDVLAELLALDPDVRAIVASGYADTPVMANYREAGFSGVLSKPFGLKRLSQVLAQLSGTQVKAPDLQTLPPL